MHYKEKIVSSESIISNLSHYIQNEENVIKPQSTTKIDESDEIFEEQITSNTDPFFEINSLDINSRANKILDYDDDSSDEKVLDTELTNLSKSWYCEVEISDDESIESETAENDLLKHAEVLQLEEIVKISKDKMTRLQSLYIDQFQRLQQTLREKRKVYLKSLKKEKEIYSNIFNQRKDTPNERKLYEELKSTNHYHQRKYGTEAILYRKFIEKRQQSEQSQMTMPFSQQKNIPKCIFSDGVKCLDRPLPQNKYCRKHILEDKKQILFKPCSIEKSGIICKEAVVNLFDEPSCVLHTSLYNLPRIYIKRKSDSDEDENRHFGMKQIRIDKESNFKDKVIASDDEIKIN